MRRKRIIESLAAALSGLAQIDVQVEQTAGKLLAIVSDQKLHTLEAFDVAIAEAYKANGWQVGSGRPAKDAADRRVVPHTVRTYVWEMRSAYREGLEVWSFPSFNALRTARKAKRAPASTPAPEPHTNGFPPEVEQDMQGVRISGAEPNGSLLHDLVLCFASLPPDARSLFGRQLARLLHRYQPQTRVTAKPQAKAA